MLCKVRVEIPIRINMLLANSRKCINPEEITGGVGFALHSNNYMDIGLSDISVISSSNKSVLEMYCNYFKKIFDYTGEFRIKTMKEITKHSGYGSTITEITALCIGINKLFGNQLSIVDIRKIIKDNYCESKYDKLIKGYDSGLGALACLEGGLIYTQNINSYVKCEWNPSYKVLLFNNGLKNRNMMNESIFVEDILRYNEQIDREKKENIINMHLIPDILNGDYENIGRDILAAHYIGSKRAECAQYGFEKQMEIIHGILENGGSIAGLSSLGPLNYSIVLERKKVQLVQYLKKHHKIRNIQEYKICLKGIKSY